jgi:hypothetical protein
MPVVLSNNKGDVAMLISMDTGEQITRIPHSGQWRQWRSRMTDVQWTEVCEELEKRTNGGEVHTAGWIPGHDWTGSPFQPIHESACRGNIEASALCFGLAVWVFMMQHDARWSFGRYDVNDTPIRSMTYFRLSE